MKFLNSAILLVALSSPDPATKIIYHDPSLETMLHEATHQPCKWNERKIIIKSRDNPNQPGPNHITEYASRYIQCTVLDHCHPLWHLPCRHFLQQNFPDVTLNSGVHSQPALLRTILATVHISLVMFHKGVSSAGMRRTSFHSRRHKNSRHVGRGILES